MVVTAVTTTTSLMSMGLAEIDASTAVLSNMAVTAVTTTTVLTFTENRVP